MFEKFVFDALVGERSGGIEAKCLQIAGQHFHCRDAASLDRRNEVGAFVEWEIRAAPQAEPLCIGEVFRRLVAPVAET